ncbi:conserved hypothetical protein [Candidatus Roizmanbacteria bacterium]|nr:conserved hypothetical protein [Candidatus Roizmanbacteria bacterium]
MNKINAIKLAKDWYITHDPYSDLFQAYDNVAFNNNKKDFVEKKYKDIRVYINKKTSLPFFLEITNVYEQLGVDIDNLVKLDILKLIEPYLNKYGRL